MESMALNTRMQMRLLSEEQLADLLTDALTVWRRVPFRIQGPDEFFDQLRDFGCSVDGESVRFPEPVIERVLAWAAEHKRSWQREAADKGPGWAGGGLSLFTHGQALQICDLDSNRLRPATTADLTRWCHVVDAFGDVSRSHPTFIPTEVPRPAADLHAFATIILNSREPHRVSVYGAAMIPFFIEACRVAKGSIEAVRRDPVFATKCWVNSPFMITRENIEIALTARRLLGRPFEFGHMPVAGAATPVTLAGALVQNTAESLGLAALRWAVNGTPSGGITGTTTMLDMRDACHRQSGPDIWLHTLAASQMQAYLFGGHPAATFACTAISAQSVSPQSLFEKALIGAFSVAAGARSLGIGSLACSDVGSPVQLFLDYELGGFFRHLLREVTVDQERVGLETILATAPRGAYYLETAHTAAFFRDECWLPAFFDSRVAAAWARDPADMVERARRRAREVYATAENQCPLTAEQRRALEQIIREAHRAARAG
jgi:trimethylamine--corrinoid protein Co-methyltransferase